MNSSKAAGDYGQPHSVISQPYSQVTRTEELLRRIARVNDLYDTRAESFDTGDVVGEDTHVTSGSGDVDLNYIGRGEDRLCYM